MTKHIVNKMKGYNIWKEYKYYEECAKIKVMNGVKNT